MKRKIIGQKDSYTVTLPKKWVEQRELKSGEEIDMLEQEDKLIISGKGEAIKKKIVVGIIENNELEINHAIAYAYINGYEEIILKSKEKIDLTKISNVLRMYLGAEISTQTKDTLKIKFYLKANEKEIPQLIEQSFNGIQELIRIIKEQWDRINLEELKLIRENTQRGTYHAMRCINVSGFKGKKFKDYNSLLHELVYLSNSLLYIGEYLKEYKPKKSIMFGQLIELFNETYESYKNPNPEKLIKLDLRARKKMNELLNYKYIRNNIKKEDPALFSYNHTLMNVIRHTMEDVFAINLEYYEE
ncbi:MAG: AbrB/MazE/SpoVT family DNA-binding domain-containing protein [Candidatus Woesearchaeota archaeon]|jgi:hypothetical protein